MAVATAEAAGDQPLLEDGVTPAVNVTALLAPLDDAQKAAYAQVRPTPRLAVYLSIWSHQFGISRLAMREQGIRREDD